MCKRVLTPAITPFRFNCEGISHSVIANNAEHLLKELSRLTLQLCGKQAIANLVHPALHYAPRGPHCTEPPALQPRLGGVRFEEEKGDSPEWR